MSQPLSPADTLFLAILEDLPPELLELACQFKAFERARKVRSPLQLLRLVLLFAGLDLTLKQTAATFTLLQNESISDTAVRNRLLACIPWVRAILLELLPKQSFQTLRNGARLLVTDSSTAQGPAAKSTDWRIHLTIDLFRLQFVHVDVTDFRGAESLERVPLLPGDIVLADRGYCRQRSLMHVQDCNADSVVRFNTGTLILEREHGEHIDLVAKLKTYRYKKKTYFPVFLTGHQRQGGVAGWIHAERASPGLRAERQRVMRQTKKRKGFTPTKDGLYLCGWLLVFTTLSPEEWTTDELLKLYRARWQVELVFKRLKSLLDLDEVRAKRESKTGELWLLGKLLYAALLEKGFRARTDKALFLLLESRSMTPWKLYVLEAIRIQPVISGAAFWHPEAWEKALIVLADRRRKRRLQALPNQVGQYLKQTLPGQSPCETGC